jgi:predicted secreted protein
MERRLFLKSAAAFGAVSIGRPDLLLNRPAIAADRAVRVAFEATSEREALNMLFPGMGAQRSGLLRLSAPYLTTPRQTTTVRVDYVPEQAEAIAITATNSDHPLIALTMFHVAAGGFATRIRLKRTSRINAYVLTAQGLFTASRDVKVTRGGYGTDFD